MRSRVVGLLTLVSLVLLAGSAQAQPRKPRRGDFDATRYGWIFSLEAGKAQARATGKPLMVVIRCVP